MKLLRSTLFALVTLALATNARAAAPIWLGFDAGFGLPMGDFSSEATAGWNAGVTGDWRRSERFALGGEVGWHSFAGTDDLEKDLSVAAGLPVDVQHSTVPVLVHAKYFLPPSATFTPYLVGGLGDYHAKTKTSSSLGDTEDSAEHFGFNLGGGLEFKNSDRVTFGVDGRFHWAGSGDESVNMLTLRGQLYFGFGK